MNKIITIIIPTYNMEDYIANALQSFLIHKNLSKIEVLVV